jgi:AAA+ superfamily predicted ATPase
VEFQTPNLSERKTLVLAFLNEAGMSIEPQQLEDFCKVLEGLSQAYIKEFCQKLIIEGNLPALIEHIKTTKRLVGEAKQGENNRNNSNGNGNKNYTTEAKEVERETPTIPDEIDF